MAMNPKDFQATPWSHNGKIDKSGPNKNLSAHGRPNIVPATPIDHFKAVPFSGEGHKALGQTAHQGIGNPYAMSSDRSEKNSGFSKPSTIAKSKPEVPSDPVKWHKKYDMSEGAHMSVEAANRFNAKEKAK